MQGNISARGFEALEDRVLCAIDIDVDGGGGLSITGGNGADTAAISLSNNGVLTITGTSADVVGGGALDGVDGVTDNGNTVRLDLAQLIADGVITAGTLSIDLGNGNNSLTIDGVDLSDATAQIADALGDPDFALAVTITGGNGRDAVSISDVDGAYATVDIDLGGGANTLHLDHADAIFLTYTGGSGVDSIHVEDSYLYGWNVTTDGGNDRVEVEDSVINDLEQAGIFTSLGGGNDRLILDDNDIIGNYDTRLGAGNDLVEAENNDYWSLTTDLDGGAGNDTLDTFDEDYHVFFQPARGFERNR